MGVTDRLIRIFPLLLLSPAIPGAAQEVPTTSALEITVEAADREQALRGAQILLDGSVSRGITNESGYLRLEGFPPGPRRLQVRYLGYAPLDAIVNFEPGRTRRILVRMNVQPIALAEVRAEGNRSTLTNRGFFERQESGFGTFLTRREIQRMNPQFMSDVLRRTSGVQVGTATFGARPPAWMRGNGPSCPIQFYIDGALTSNFNIDEVMPGDVEGVEIYRGSATLPPAYNRGTARCGVILIWTRVE